MEGDWLGTCLRRQQVYGSLQEEKQEQSPRCHIPKGKEPIVCEIQAPPFHFLLATFSLA
jgi:hypothetical protein